jgi:hypothetical protein
MYIENGRRAGFWIQHRSWRDVCAQVVNVEARTVVCMRYFDVRSGREVTAMPAEDDGFAMIAEPPWCRRSPAVSGAR